MKRNIFFLIFIASCAWGRDPKKIFDGAGQDKKPAPVQADAPPLFHKNGAEGADRLVKKLSEKQIEFARKFEAVSEAFLGTPFKWGPLGEGKEGLYDSDPLISFEFVDCVTFVEQAMALARASSGEEAMSILQKIRYKNGQISFESRNHFPSVDWIPNNIQAGFLKDITRDAGGKLTKIATKTIKKKEWYVQKSTANLEGPSLASLNEEEKLARVAQWRKLGENMPEEQARLDYVPLENLKDVLSKIPSGTVVSIVREDRPAIAVLISHQGLLIWKDGKSYFRHAAFNESVKDAPFLEYFDKYAKAKWPAVGVHLALPLGKKE